MVEHRHSTSGAVHSHTPDTALPSWSVRIPAAIKNAEAWLAETPERDYRFLLKPRTVITAGEVAAIKELWDYWWDSDRDSDVPTPALIAFTEKVEKLT